MLADMTQPSPCCPLCRQTDMEDISTGDRIPFREPVCNNPSCPCHSPAPKDSRLGAGVPADVAARNIGPTPELMVEVLKEFDSNEEKV